MDTKGETTMIVKTIIVFLLFISSAIAESSIPGISKDTCPALVADKSSPQWAYAIGYYTQGFVFQRDETISVEEACNYAFSTEKAITICKAGVLDARANRSKTLKCVVDKFYSQEK